MKAVSVALVLVPQVLIIGYVAKVILLQKLVPQKVPIKRRAPQQKR
jgi:hypothetical protein